MLASDSVGPGGRRLPFVVGRVKSLVDAAFQSAAGPETAGIPGSSIGGLLNVYGVPANASVSGFCGAFRVNYRTILIRVFFVARSVAKPPCRWLG